MTNRQKKSTLHIECFTSIRKTDEDIKFIGRPNVGFDAQYARINMGRKGIFQSSWGRQGTERYEYVAGRDD